jgi:acetylornithine deacetylase/succinyl-diaminopimelate desuccinylase-like protein
MIRMNTVNPPGNELQVARYLDSTLKAAGIETHLFEPTPGRGALVARHQGQRAASARADHGAHGRRRRRARRTGRSIPFAAEIKGDYLVRARRDRRQGMLAANLETMLLLKRTSSTRGARSSRDVIFVANSDEEQSGEWGMGWLIANHPELIKAEFALNEGGRVRIVGGSGCTSPCRTRRRCRTP